MNNFLPGLYIVSTPIGNLEDITLRALNVLKNSDKILCEDTRRSIKLLNYYGIKKKLIPNHKFNEKKITNSIIELIKKGERVSIISDAGTPTLSDPGLILIKECIKRKIKIFPIPGVSAVTTAMSVSGFDEKYFFYGFLSKKSSEIEKEINEIKNYNSNIVFFIPAIKLNFYVNYFKKFFKSRQIFIGREMTKIHESFYRESIDKFEGFTEPLQKSCLYNRLCLHATEISFIHPETQKKETIHCPMPDDMKRIWADLKSRKRPIEETRT